MNKHFELNRKKQTPIDWENSSKDIIFFEDFSNDGFDNWTVMGDGTENWVLSDTEYADGEVPEAHMKWWPAFMGTSRFVSPVTNTDLSYWAIDNIYVGDPVMYDVTPTDIIGLISVCP